MSELLGRSFLRSLSNAARQLREHGFGEAVDDAISALVDAAEILTAGTDEALLSIVGDAYYLGPKLMAHASTEFEALLVDLAARGVESVTILPAAHRSDLVDLAALAAGLPSSAGVALGVDRLVMLAAGAADLSEVVAFPVDRA